MIKHSLSQFSLEVEYIMRNHFLSFNNALNQANLHREILFPQLISVKEGQIQGA